MLLKTDNMFSGALAGLLTSVTASLGGWDLALKILLAFQVIDYITGLLAAWKRNELDSEIMLWGGVRKAMTLIVVGVAVMFDHLVNGGEPMFRTLAVYFYVAREGLSVTENLGLLGVQLPDFIKDALVQLNKRAGVKEEKKEE
jgi:toxin secretion/phage lysis holin